jgi:predicted GIY-YIG superfamily endonuclease
MPVETRWFYVYYLRSLSHPKRTYVGFTTRNPEERLAEHNAGDSDYTGRHRPWQLLGFTTFTDETLAREFETYLKSGAGNRFAQKHLFKL